MFAMASMETVDLGGHLICAASAGAIGPLAAAAFCFISPHIHQKLSRERPSTSRSIPSHRSHPAARNGHRLFTRSAIQFEAVSNGPLSQTKKSGYTWLFSHQ